MAAPTVQVDDILLLFVLQYLEDRDLVETARSLERETGIFFNMQFFEELILSGSFDEAEDYFEGFTSIDENKFSNKTIFEIKKLKLLEALDDGARRFATDIVRTEFPQFSEYNDQIYDQAMQLVAMEDFRAHESLRNFDKAQARIRVVNDLKKCINLNPVFRGKLQFPPLETTLQCLFTNREGERMGTVGLLPILDDNGNN